MIEFGPPSVHLDGISVCPFFATSFRSSFISPKPVVSKWGYASWHTENLFWIIGRKISICIYAAVYTIVSFVFKIKTHAHMHMLTHNMHLYNIYMHTHVHTCTQAKGGYMLYPLPFPFLWAHIIRKVWYHWFKPSV